jgi:hypothetical protein
LYIRLAYIDELAVMHILRQNGCVSESNCECFVDGAFG